MSSTKYLHILYDKDFDEINFYNECHLTKSPSCYRDSQLESNFIKKQNNLHRISAQCPRGNKKSFTAYLHEIIFTLILLALGREISHTKSHTKGQ